MPYSNYGGQPKGTIMNVQKLNSQMHPLDEAAMRLAKARWDGIAKPVGSLGQLEELTIRIAGIQRGEPNIDKRGVLVLCADNGVCCQGVASTPAEITAVMAGFIAQKRSSVCVMARCANADVIPVDMGMLTTVPEAALLERRIASGTADMTQGPAMTRAQAEQAIETGIELVRSCKEQGYRILATGKWALATPRLPARLRPFCSRAIRTKWRGAARGSATKGWKRRFPPSVAPSKSTGPTRRTRWTCWQNSAGSTLRGSAAYFSAWRSMAYLS